MEKRRLSALAAFREKVAEMEAKGMKAGKPGDECGCGCYYEGRGGSSTNANDSANDAGGKHSKPVKSTSPDDANEIPPVYVTPSPPKDSVN